MKQQHPRASAGEEDRRNADQAQGELVHLDAGPRSANLEETGRAERTPVTPMFVEPRDVPSSGAADVDIARVKGLCRRLLCARASGKVPLFVVGAGVSEGRVPLLKEIAGWFSAVVNLKGDGRPNVEALEPRFGEFLKRLSDGAASRADAAEFFSTLQLARYSKFWAAFSKAFLLGPQIDESIPALKLGRDRKDFDGLLVAEFSDAHGGLARMLQAREAHVLSLNFDGLTVRALTKNHGSGVALHTRQQVRAYFSATKGHFVPAVIKVRGDVFYAKCSEPMCPASNEEHPLDRLSDHGGGTPVLRCPACGRSTVVLQFSFPGFRVKEEAAYPILWEARRFLAQRLSAIIILGLSGRWDRYLLDFLFDLAVERGLVVADVKPLGSDGAVIDSFRETYYPSCRAAVGTDVSASGSEFVRVALKADRFYEVFLEGYTVPGGKLGAS